jgi:glucan endo-1,3-alpha-glucosidase
MNFPQRIGQVLALAPDFLEILTWNDAGEGHYVGNVWPESIAGSDIGAYSNGYDHSGWQSVLPSLIAAYKAGARDVSALVPTGNAAAQGAFWYRTLLKSAACSADPLGKPSGWENAQDVLNYAVLLPAGTNGVRINFFSGGQRIGSFAGVAGLNYGMVDGIMVGDQSMQVVDANGNVIMTATGPAAVTADTNGLCNFNYQVAALK